MGKRRQRRLCVKDLTITINGKTYQVFNINAYGVGFLIDSPTEITPGTDTLRMTINGPAPVRVAGIARHISELIQERNRLPYKTGWICGTEFTTRRDLDGGKLLKVYLCEIIDSDVDE